MLNSGTAEIDEITWNDLDLEHLFGRLNSTCSQNGGEYLYGMLRRPLIGEEGKLLLKERGRVSELFKNDTSLRDLYREALKDIRDSKGNRYTFSERRDMLLNVESDGYLVHILALILGGLSLSFIFIYPPAGFVLFIIAALFNVITYFKRKAAIEACIPVLRYLIKEIRESRRLLKLNEAGLEEYNGRLKTALDSLKGMDSLSFILFSGKRLTGGIMELPIDFIRIFLHPDLIRFNTLIDMIKREKAAVDEIFEISGFLDAMIALAGFKERLPYYSEPVFKENGGIEIKKGYHPLLKDPVPYDMDNVSLMLLTGSNASGKSTFLKSVAISIIFAETLYTVPAEAFATVPMEIYSSMSLRDNILEGDSLYVTEIKSVKRITDRVQSGIKAAIFLDEVLKGTNTVERIASLSVLLKSLRNAPYCFAATHDTPLTEILEDIYDNYHFDENVTEYGITFPYELKKGRTGSRDAIKLLTVMGLSREITDEAFRLSDTFLKEGIWEKI